MVGDSKDLYVREVEMKDNNQSITATMSPPLWVDHHNTIFLIMVNCSKETYIFIDTAYMQSFLCSNKSQRFDNHHIGNLYSQNLTQYPACKPGQAHHVIADHWGSLPHSIFLCPF
mmetsp:Transcript_45446/g.95387  ORF Transcript_45446/g.95387 Transcript_45446/m.95387 type:complete len:115 (+) Transcript_45446:95-439(+)